MILYTSSLCWWYLLSYLTQPQVSPPLDPKSSTLITEHLKGSRTVLIFLYPRI